jgi:hypothetical protein
LKVKENLGCLLVAMLLLEEKNKRLHLVEVVANMASYAISSSLILVIHDNMIIGTNHIV